MTTLVPPSGRVSSPRAGIGVSRPFAAAAVVAAAGIPIWRILPGQAGTIWTAVVLGLLAVGPVLTVMAQPKWPGIWIFAAIAAIGAGFGSSGPDSPLVSNMLLALQFSIMLGLGPFVLRALWEREPRAMRGAVAVFLAVQTFSAVAGLLQLVGRPVFGYAALLGRSPGLAGHPNLLGVMSTIAILVLAHVAVRGGSRYPRLVLAGLLINIGGLIATGSLSAMAAALLGVGLLIFGDRVKPSRILAVAGLFVVAAIPLSKVPFVAEYFRDPTARYLQVTGQTDDIGTLDVRVVNYKAAWESIKADPLGGRGLGVGNATAVDSQVHNLLMHAWYQGGLLLVAAMTVIVIAVIVLTAKSFTDRDLVLPAVVLVAILIYAMSSAFFREAYYWLPVLAAWGSIPRTRPAHAVRNPGTPAPPITQ